MKKRTTKTNLKGKEVKMMKKIFMFLSMIALCLVMTASANAVPVGGLIWPDGTATLLSDNSADFIIDGDGDPTTVGVDDILVTIVGINTIEGTSNQTIGAGTIYNELTAISAVKINSYAPLLVNAQGLLIGNYTAIPVTLADVASFDWATGTILGGAFTFTTQAGLSNDGVQMGLLYEDSANNYTRDGAIQTGLTNATDGIFRLSLGLDTTVDPNDLLQVFAPVNLAALAAFAVANPSTNINLTNISLDATILSQNWPGLNFFTNITGGAGGFSTPTLTSQWPAFDNLDFTVKAVPEPATFVLLGTGLLGAGIYSRIRRRK